MSILKKNEKISASQALKYEFDILMQQNMPGHFDPALSEALRGLDQRRDPPSNNMGGTYPPPPLFLPQCEKNAVKIVNKAKIDFLAFTSSADVEALRVLLAVIWPDVVFSRNGHGMQGYPESMSITVDEVQYGLLGYGAPHGRNYVSLTGTACKTLDDELVEVFHEALSLPGIEAVLSRIDLCFDFYKGERTIEHALWSYEQGAFKRPRASSHPELKQVGTTKGGANWGRTVYVGKRGGHVMARIYEKGLEVFAKLPEEMQFQSECRELEALEAQGQAPQVAFKADDWLRIEVEYRRQGKDILLPLDMMLRRDEYFAGAYPYCADALGVADGVRPAGLKSDFDVDLLALMAHAKNSYGSLIHSLKELGFRDSEVVEYLSSGRNNNKLVRSGLLARIKRSVEDFKAADPDFDIPF